VTPRVLEYRSQASRGVNVGVGVSDTWGSTYVQNTRLHIPENDSLQAHHHEYVYVCMCYSTTIYLGWRNENISFETDTIFFL
jgi:hypothetical protein